MKTKPAYLVIDTGGRQPTISRVTQRWPQLYQGEIVVRVEIDIPGPPFNPVHTIAVREVEMAAIEVLVPEVPEEER